MNEWGVEASCNLSILCPPLHTALMLASHSSKGTWVHPPFGSPEQQGASPVVPGLLSTPPQIWFNSASLLWTILQPREAPREWDRVLEAGRMDREKGQRREGEGCVAPCSL